jgi:PAS domain S-box-containing protein
MSAALWQTDHRLAMAERMAHIGSWTLPLPGQQLVHSSEFAAILGLAAGTSITLDDLIGRFTPECRDRIRLLLQQCSQRGIPFDEEMQIETTAASRKWVRTACEALHNKRGQVKGLQGALQDISAQKQAQQETLRLAMRLTTTLASITDAFVTLDRQCCFTYLNQESERLLLHTTRELLGKEIWQILVTDANQRLRQQLQRSIATNRRVEFEDFYPGLGKWLEVRAYPFAEGLAVYFRDVSTRRKSQEQLMLLETCISRLNDMVVIAEALPASENVPYIVFVNEAFEYHTGYSRHEVLGQTPRKLLGSGTAGELQRISTALSQHQQTRSELMVYRKDGSCFWLELEIVRVLAPSARHRPTPFTSWPSTIH